MIYAMDLIGPILAAFSWGHALAFTVTDGIDAVSSTSMPGGTGTSFGGIIATVADSLIPIAAGAAVLAMTIAGFFLALSGNENQTTTARRVFISGIAGLALINIAPFFASALFSGPVGPTILSAPGGAGSVIAAEALGLVTFLEIPLGVVCVLMIIISGIRAIINFGSEDGITQLRRTVLFVVGGFILVYTRSLIGIGIAVNHTPYSVISIVLGIVQRIIVLVILIAITMVVYAGILMIANIGKEEQYSKAKGLLLRVAIGLVVMIASAGIIHFLTSVVR